MVRKIADPVFSVYIAANLQGLTDLISLHTVFNFFSAEDLIQLIFQQLERTTKFILHPALQGIIFKIHICAVCRAMNSVLLSEASGHYGNKTAKYGVESLLLKSSNNHH